MGVKFITSKEAAELIEDNSVVIAGGFIGSGVAEEIHESVGKRFEETGSPKNLTLFYAAGIGDGKVRGLNHYAKEGLIKRVIGGHWGLAPKLQPFVASNSIEAYNLPQGVISQMFRDIAAKKPFHITRVGLGTFVDPDIQGGKLNDFTKEDIVTKMTYEDEDYLVYKLPKPDIAILKGSYADELGNVSFEEEPLTLEAISIAMAVKNNGGKVIIQVRKKVKAGSLEPKFIRVPRVIADYIVEVEDYSKHMQTFGTQFNLDFIKPNVLSKSTSSALPLNERKVIGRRAAMFLSNQHSVVNYGIGMPESVPMILKEEGIDGGFIPTVEPGIFGGIPQGGLDFGCAVSPEAIIDQSYMFDFYDGGGIDVAFLGLAQCDKQGNINVSQFGPKIAGAGGFINITQNAGTVVFCGTFTAGGLKVDVKDGKIAILEEGKNKKFLSDVEQITFSGKVASDNNKEVYYVTERALFKLIKGGVKLIEIAPGIDLQKDILNQMDFKPEIDDNLKQMDIRIFKDSLMELK